MMRKQSRILLAVILSVLLHCFIVFFFSLQIKARKDPLIYCWPDILSKEDLFSKKAKVSYPPEADFSADALRNKHFSPFSFLHKNPCDIAEEKIYPRKDYSVNHLKEGLDYFYLWEKPDVFISEKREVIPYNVLCSSRGKVIFSYPQKLSLDSKQALYVQKHIREAALFLKDNFFWTKIHGVIE
jgi:hypothetical protein